MQQSMNLSPPDLAAAPREIHKNYVFVDEHNRHKRLKVMRACEGCRRRKIKCDAATTNTWPCSACTRLKLHCVPPMLQYDREYMSTQIVSLGHEPHVGFGDAGGGGEDELLHQRIMGKASRPANYHRESSHYRSLSQELSQEHHNQAHTQMPYSTMTSAETIEPQLSVPHFQAPVYHTPEAMRQPEQWQAGDDYASALGSLKIDDDGVAGYISAQGRRLAKTPAYEPWDDEAEPNNPSFMPGQHEFAVKIRPGDMPSDNEAAEMFNIFFNHIHPYIPIVNKSTFFDQWNTQRDQISPLLLETIFACAGRLTTQPAKGLKWITMATKHVDCFFDVPRLSTVQALLLLLKARESAPQRGYFFRSWMSMVNIIAMARDLHLDSHYELHKQGIGCQETECNTRTRVWQACFAYELMICAPQGRNNMQCDPSSVDLSTSSRSCPDLDDQEVTTHRNFVHFVRLISNIRRMSDVHARLKANPSWRHDPQFLQSGPSLEQWSYGLPADLHIRVDTDLTQPGPQPETHFSGNLQVYYHLARIMLHRPALAFGKTFSGGEWRRHMAVCTNAAKSICRLEEVIFELYGMLGLQCMSRGVNFSIYSLLSGAMVHLIAATCPDGEFNHDAKEYFTRTMRLLENCIDNSASSEMKGQIETLREAFSVDVSRPFVLNPSFPFYHGVSASIDPHVPRAYTQADAGQVTYATHPLSPPHSIGESETKGDSPTAVQSLVMMAAGQGVQPPPPPQHDNIAGWNPSRLFDNWNAAFGHSSVGGSVAAAMPPSLQPQHSSHHEESGLDSLGGAQNSSSPYVSNNTVAISNSFVSPGMWQDSVAAAMVFSGAGKRAFPFDTDSWSNAPPIHGITRTAPPGIALRTNGPRVHH